MDNVNVELIAVVIGMIVSGVVVGLFVWLTSKNASAAIVGAVEAMMQNIPAMDAIEATIDELPDEVNAIIDALVSIGIRYTEGTATEADDAIMEMLRKLTDGQPNAAVG